MNVKFFNYNLYKNEVVIPICLSIKLLRAIHPLKFYRDFLEHNIRPDGRDLMKYRPVVINIDSIGTADGSSIVKIGNTTVVCGIKAELAPPKAAEPENGFVITNIELTPLCSSKFRPGPPAEEAQIYSQCLYDVVMNSGIIDFKDLCIAKEKLVWNLYCDLACIDHNGCVLDAAIIALVAALKSVRLPTINYNPETESIQVDEKTLIPLNIKSTPIGSSFMLFDELVK